jgi:hypothetical protein
MGYGHQRAAYPLFDLSGREIITANNYPGILEWEVNYWQNSLNAYEKISRLKKIPILGAGVFAVMNYFQKIKPFYPFRDLSALTSQQFLLYKVIKKGLGKKLIDDLSANGLPLVTTFFAVVYMAEYHNFQGDIYCIVCDADISRAWAPVKPAKSRTKYFAPNQRVRKRLMMYGVKDENIIVTGFPLPAENIGAKQEIAKEDLARRINALDPKGVYRQTEKVLVKKVLPDILVEDFKVQAPTITFAVGGAGAQKEIGALILEKLALKIREKKVNLNLVAGSRPEVAQYFKEEVEKNGLSKEEGVKIIFEAKKMDYFKAFNLVLRKTDILWTKPSELSFYSALGLPIVMSTPVGSQEDFNREWLMETGGGLDSRDPRYVNEWLFDLLNSGRLARAAMDGFLNAEKMGTYNITKHFSKK